MFNKMLDFLRNTTGDNMNDTMLLMRKKTEQDFLYEITNGRSIPVNKQDKHLDKILNGYDFIQAFVNRGINLNGGLK